MRLFFSASEALPRPATFVTFGLLVG